MLSDLRAQVILVVATAAYVIAGCSSDPFADKVSAEDESVMRAMIEISCKLDVERLVISDRPAVPRLGDRRHAAGSNVQFGIDINQRIAHEARWPLGQICPVVRVIDDTAIEEVQSHDTRSWDKFIAAFGGARSLMRISLPVYSVDGKRAVIYTSGSCPYTCGAGFYHELEKGDSGWRVLRSVIAWTS